MRSARPAGARASTRSRSAPGCCSCLAALGPETYWDGFEYHLPIAKAWAESGIHALPGVLDARAAGRRRSVVWPRARGGPARRRRLRLGRLRARARRAGARPRRGAARSPGRRLARRALRPARAPHARERALELRRPRSRRLRLPRTAVRRSLEPQRRRPPDSGDGPVSRLRGQREAASGATDSSGAGARPARRTSAPSAPARGRQRPGARAW